MFSLLNNLTAQSRVQQLKNNAIKTQAVLHFPENRHGRTILTRGTANYWLHENVTKQQEAGVKWIDFVDNLVTLILIQLQ